MFTSKKKVIIDFDSERISVMENGILLKSAPASVIRKKSETPVAVAYCEDAEKRKLLIKDSELYCRPFKNGKITDENAAKILFRSVLKELFGNSRIRIFVLISGGLSEEETDRISSVFAGAGYGKVTLIPRPVVLGQLLEYNSMYAGLYMDSDVSEFVLCSGGHVLCAHTIDVSTTATAELLRDKFISENKLKLSLDTSFSIAKNDCSLFKGDASQIIAVGKDAITSGGKSIFVSAKDVYPLVESVYQKVADLISAVLMDESKDFALEVANSGIIYLGSGTQICGFEEFMYRRLGINGIIGRDRSLLLAVASSYVEKLRDE